MYSCPTKVCILIELTSPCEENFLERNLDKPTSYEELCQSIESNGWKSHLFPVEVGARGYCGKSLLSCLRRLGLNTKIIKSTINTLSLASVKASFEIWLSRNCHKWSYEDKTIKKVFHRISVKTLLSSLLSSLIAQLWIIMYLLQIQKSQGQASQSIQWQTCTTKETHATSTLCYSASVFLWVSPPFYHRDRTFLNS